MIATAFKHGTGADPARRHQLVAWMKTAQEYRRYAQECRTVAPSLGAISVKLCSPWLRRGKNLPTSGGRDRERGASPVHLLVGRLP